MSDKKVKYGRGKFQAAPEYIDYMEMIVEHETYKNMPNAKSDSGKINWQVSSGKTTSFYKDYLARKAWWISKANELMIPGKDAENGRFTLTARIIHPTGYRACMLCGGNFNVGYFYINANFTKKLMKDFPNNTFYKEQPIDLVIETLKETVDEDDVSLYFINNFPERKKYFDQFGISKLAFEKSNYIKSTKLSPGYMGNPPDRLDGFHDYHGSCRKNNDPGRSDENMSTYEHDRRSFELWSEGNWAVADTLYNLAGPGSCIVPDCGKKLKKVSPDHIGPLACGFKQLALFQPMCTKHNSAKNRRFTFNDIQILIHFELTNDTSVASWQVRRHWDKYKNLIKNDNEAKVFSNSLRSLQDMYFRTLKAIYDSGKIRFLATLLRPELAYMNYSFENLNTEYFTYDSIILEDTTKTYSRKSLANRSVRIAFESLLEYNNKSIEKRKMIRSDFADNQKLIVKKINMLKSLNDPNDKKWIEAIVKSENSTDKEKQIRRLLDNNERLNQDIDIKMKNILHDLFDEIGKNAIVDFDKY